jgi:hypothetical protein
MSYFVLASMAIGAIVLPCLIAFLCMPLDDGRRI